jgi:hypothetical protein
MVKRRRRRKRTKDKKNEGCIFNEKDIRMRGNKKRMRGNKGENRRRKDKKDEGYRGSRIGKMMSNQDEGE